MKERAQDRTINLEHIGTKEMLANPLRKAYQPIFFRNMLPAWD
jgi:hypothetical protein